jgi:hypothetical protein
MTYTSVQRKATMRRDILKGILCQAIHRAGVGSTLELTLRRLPGLWWYGGDWGGNPGGPRGHPAGTGVWHVCCGRVHHASLRCGKSCGCSDDGWRRDRIGTTGGRMAGWSGTGTPSSRSRLRRTAAWASRPKAFSANLARRQRRHGARLASPICGGCHPGTECGVVPE